MHIIAFCVNRRKRFHITGHHIINEIKDIMRNSDIKTIILEAVPSSRKFYNNQGFKIDPARRDPDNVPMISFVDIAFKKLKHWSPHEHYGRLGLDFTNNFRSKKK